jgi:hypothetical protein
MAFERATFAKDFFLEVMTDSQSLRAGHLAERERWLRALAVDGREEVLFEFEMLLRGIERTFNLHNLPLEGQGPVVARDFAHELRAIRDAINRSIKLARFLLDATSDRKMVFRKYIESRVADDRVRRELMEAELVQRAPQESLFLLRSGFIALRGILDELLATPHAGYPLFCHIGQLALREVAVNTYFKPFRPLEFRPEYDRIKHVAILELLQRVDDELRRPVAVAFLALFRLLHYLRYVPSQAEKPNRRSLVIMALVRSEVGSLCAFLEGDLAHRLGRSDPERAKLAARVGGDLREEERRIVLRELTGAPTGSTGRARDAFGAAFRRTVSELARAYDESLRQVELFDDLLSRQEQSLRLRRDLHAFREVCRFAETAFPGAAGLEGKRALSALRDFALYFRDVSYQLLRYGDYEPFDRFSSLISDTDTALSGPLQFQRLADECRLFGEVLDQVLAAVGRRDDLCGNPFDASEGDLLAAKYTRENRAAPA